MSASVVPAELASSRTAAHVQELAAGYTRTQRILELSGVTAWFTLAATTTAYTAVAIAHSTRPAAASCALVIGGLVASLLFADFISGFVHWAADNWGHESWPIVGATFIRPFRHHHLDAQDITRHPFLELNGNNCIVSLPQFALALALIDTSAGSLFGSVFSMGVAIWVMGTNQFHAWAHSDAPPPVVQALQRRGIILSTAHHNVHHAAPHDRNYCITTGWFNAPLRAVRFFEALEWIITRATGVKANHHSIAPARK